MDAVMIALFLAMFVKAALDALADIVRTVTKKPDLDLSWFIVLALVFGAGLSWILSLNVFEFLRNPFVGRILTALATGFGVSFLNTVLAPAQNRTLAGLVASLTARKTPTAVTRGGSDYSAVVAPPFRIRGW